MRTLTNGVWVVAAVTAAQSLLILRTPDRGLEVDLVLQAALLGSFAIWSARATGSYLNAPLMLVTAIYFWHSTFLTAHFLSSIPEFEYTGNTLSYGEEYMSRASALVALCMTCAVVGTLLAFRLPMAEPIRDGARPALRASAAQFAWIVLLAFAALTAAYFLVEGVPRFHQSYLSLYLTSSGSVVDRVFQSTKFFGVVAILMVFATRRSRGLPYAAIGVSGLIVFANLLLGSRSLPYIYGLAALVCIDRFVWRLSVLEVATLAVAASALSFTIDHARAYGIGLQVFDLSRTGRSIDLLHIFSNAGGVIKTVLRTMAFSSGRTFFYGRSILDAVVYLLPRRLVDGVGLGTGFVRPSDWLLAYSGDVPMGEGMGYSLVAEAYLNFGYVGCLLFLALGWFVGRQYATYLRSGDRVAWVHASNVAVVLSLHMRSDAAAYLRVLVYGWLLIEALRWISARWERVRVVLAPAVR